MIGSSAIRGFQALSAVGSDGATASYLVSARRGVKRRNLLDFRFCSRFVAEEDQVEQSSLIAVAGLLAVLAVWLWRGEVARRRAEARQAALQDVTLRLAEAQQAATGRLDQLSQSSAAELAQLRQAVQERLDAVARQMGESLQQSATRTALSLGEISKHLTVIDQAQQNIKELSGQVVGLQNILDNKQARGAFGEVQLRDLVQSALPAAAYEFQFSLGNGRRVDCLIRLPQPPGSIGIDAKFPLESYRQLRDAKTELALKQAQAAFRQAIHKHVTDIAERYIVAGETAESALMFLPSEAIYAELHANFPDAVERSHRANVWIVSPNTLMATLHTVRAVLKDARMREQADLIQQEVQRMVADVRRLDQRVGKLQQHFNQVQEDVRQIGISTGKIQNRADRIERVELQEVADEPADDSQMPQRNLEILR
jgi:DNA recombination protein RmuC